MRPALAAALLLTGCAAPSVRRYVLLESESYMCGAAEGLGCGLALQPLLESIDGLEGVVESGASWDGRTIRVELLPEADPDQVASAATALMEGEACCVTEPRGQAEPGKNDQWFNSKQTVALSRHEAGVIASDFANAISAEVQLEPGVAERVHAALREELERAFEQAHAAGGGVHRLWEQLPTARPKLEARLAELLTPAQSEQVWAVIDRELEA
jgi:hypothetical protein